jgi:hypothetical protein
LIFIFRKVQLDDRVEEDEMGGACSANGEKGEMCRLLVGKLEGKRPLGRPRRRWARNVKVDLGDV